VPPLNFSHPPSNALPWQPHFLRYTISLSTSSIELEITNANRYQRHVYRIAAERISPREFLRARRPERFSDSVVDEKLTLDRSMLEYHRDTLTNRGQEVQFEHFARRLAEREICPNLLPQTGPTGGGDSKVDSETYPVADQILLGWYIGIGREAASERWAFAFSAKKKWQEKVRSDVAKIVTTGRGYQKIFFVSNQFIRDKARAKVEDDLRAKHGIDVRILDRTWILDKVFANGHEALAIEELGLITSTRKEVRKGPLDVRRERELGELEERIQEALQQQRSGLQLVDDCTRAAILSRELLWAGRGTLLRAASLATDELWRYGAVTPLQAACYGRLKWLDLQLGRLPHILAWHEVDSVVRRILADQGYDTARLAEGEQAFDLILGILLLKTDLWELMRISTMPDVLKRLGLPGASTALIYALGYEEELRNDGFCQAWGEEDIHTIFPKWHNQPALEDLPERPSLYDGTKVTLSSTILGWQITVESENATPCVELAESLLAALESLLSTGAVERMVAREPTLTIAVRKSDFAKQPFDFELQDRAGRPQINIACRVFDPHSMSLEAQSEIQERLTELLASIIGRTIMIENPERLLEKLFRDELALERSIGFTGSFVTVGNILGYAPKTQISSWADRQAREYSLKRLKSWDADDTCTEKQPNSDAGRAIRTLGKGEPPPELLDWGRTKHTQIQTVSLIREPLWEAAKWCGTAFFVSLSGSFPPILAPVFKSSEAAKQIFALWRCELGICDEEERLRVAIIRAIDTSHPYAYRVIIGANPNVGFSRLRCPVYHFCHPYQHDGGRVRSKP
jgi:hypothetical protein